MSRKKRSHVEKNISSFDAVISATRSLLQNEVRQLVDVDLSQIEDINSFIGFKINDFDLSVNDQRKLAFYAKFFAEVDSRLQRPGASLKCDSAAWEKLCDYNRRVAEQNKMLNSMPMNTWLATILLIAAARIDSAIVDVFSQYFTHDSFDESVTYGSQCFPINGFDVGPGAVLGYPSCVSIVDKFPENGYLMFFRRPAGVNMPTYLAFDSENQRLSKVIDHVLFHHKSLDGLNMQVLMADSAIVSFVPKDKEISRDITPQCNGSLLLQFPMGNMLTAALKEMGIDLSKQPKENQRLARLGSCRSVLDFDLVPGGRPVPCTIDLKGASHMIGTVLCDWLFPQDIYSYMMLARPSVTYNRQQHVAIRNEMMATMGNAFCFPMQTMVFKSICDAVAIASGYPDLCDSISVFGDDIVVPRAVYRHVIKVLEALLMIPNPKKSFAEGSFRESCGCDAYEGVNIRAPMPRTLEALGDVYSFVNSYIDWCHRSRFIPSEGIFQTLAHMIVDAQKGYNEAVAGARRRNNLRPKKPTAFYVVPLWESDASGLRVSATAMARLGELNLPAALWFLSVSKFEVTFDRDIQGDVINYRKLCFEPRLHEGSIQGFHVNKMSSIQQPVSTNTNDDRVVSYVNTSTMRMVQREAETTLATWDYNPEKDVVPSDARYAMLTARLVEACVRVSCNYPA